MKKTLIIRILLPLLGIGLIGYGFYEYGLYRMCSSNLPLEDIDLVIGLGGILVLVSLLTMLISLIKRIRARSRRAK